MNKSSQRVLVAMSGGVDSSVSAYLLKKQGYDVVGVSLHLWDYSQNQKSSQSQEFDTCCSEEDRTDARLAAEMIDIPFYVMDYQKEFKENVVDPFVDSYLAGKTPNPCVACNTFLKFDLLFQRAKRLNCDYIATGHYARIEKSTEGYQLLKGTDPLKDQSYFLYHLEQELLSQILFPVGHLTKEEVRKIAKEANLPNANKKESMEICFVPQNNYADFVEKQGSQKLTPGKIVLSNGQVLAEHTGIHQFTVGQRKGLKISYPEPLYVIDINADTGDVTVGEEKYLWKTGFFIEGLHWLGAPKVGEQLDVKIRYRSQSSPAILEERENKPFVRFEKPQKTVTPGQVAVFYKDTQILGGGFIESSL